MVLNGGAARNVAKESVTIYESGRQLVTSRTSQLDTCRIHGILRILWMVHIAWYQTTNSAIAWSILAVAARFHGNPVEWGVVVVEGRTPKWALLGPAFEVHSNSIRTNAVRSGARDLVLAICSKYGHILKFLSSKVRKWWYRAANVPEIW